MWRTFISNLLFFSAEFLAPNWFRIGKEDGCLF